MFILHIYTHTYMLSLFSVQQPIIWALELACASGAWSGFLRGKQAPNSKKFCFLEISRCGHIHSVANINADCRLHPRISKGGDPGGRKSDFCEILYQKTANLEYDSRSKVHHRSFRVRLVCVRPHWNVERSSQTTFLLCTSIKECDFG